MIDHVFKRSWGSASTTHQTKNFKEQWTDLQHTAFKIIPSSTGILHEFVTMQIENFMIFNLKSLLGQLPLTYIY